MNKLPSDILFNLAFTILGMIVGRYYTLFADKRQITRRTKKVKRELIDRSLKFSDNNGVVVLEHGKPTFKVDDIDINDCGKSLIITIPQEFRARLIKNDPAFVFRNSVSFNNTNSFNDIALSTKIPDLPNLIEVHSKKVALDFIKRQEDNRVVFNGQMFGVKNVYPKRFEKEERNQLMLDLYQTDFYTYQVFASIFQELKGIGHPISHVSKIEELKNSSVDYSPFLSSFGLCNFVLLYNESAVVLAERSQYITHQERKYHYSMNEAFSQTDIDHNGKPSLYQCLYRGLEEELFIKNETVFANKPQFLDLVFSKDKFEMGITSVISIENLSFDELRNSYQSAPDRSLETHDIILIDLTKEAIKEFLKDHVMTSGAELGLMLLLTRHVNRVLKYGE